MEHHTRKFGGNATIIKKVMKEQNCPFRLKLNRVNMSVSHRIECRVYLTHIQYELCISGTMGYPNFPKSKIHKTFPTCLNGQDILDTYVILL